MHQITIGDWVARFSYGNDGALSRGHLVDSTVATRVVMRCGREMKREIPYDGHSGHGGTLMALTQNELTEYRHKLLLCKQCEGKQ